MSPYGPCPSCRAPVREHTTCPHCGFAVGDLPASERFLPVPEPAYGLGAHRSRRAGRWLGWAVLLGLLTLAAWLGARMAW